MTSMELKPAEPHH